MKNITKFARATILTFASLSSAAHAEGKKHHKKHAKSEKVQEKTEQKSAQ